MVSIFLALALFAGCVSLDRYDEWDSGQYETEKAELERFEEIKSNYTYVIDFDSKDDLKVIREENGSGSISEGIYLFEHNSGTEFHHFNINIEELSKQAGRRISKIAVLLKANNRGNGFVEIWPGDDLEGGNPNSVNNSGITAGSWSLLEFFIEGNATKVKGKGFNKTLQKPMEILSPFCFNGSKVEIDYILFE